MIDNPPLENSKDIADLGRCVELHEALAADVPPELRELFTRCFDSAERHRAIISRLGRFLHRNAALGQASTAEETELKQPGSSF